MAALSLNAAITGPVRVTGGQVSGVPGKDPSIVAFKGIPFAAPPVGALRWRAPKPVVPGKESRKPISSAIAVSRISSRNASRSEEHTSELQSRRYLHSFPTRRSSDLGSPLACAEAGRAWQGIKKADQFGNSCIQNIVTERKPHTYEFMAHNAISEDCLYINVWTAARTPSGRRPVYMYIYGGGNTEGSS